MHRVRVCEPRCPSRDLTLTPRQRIVVRREMERLRTTDRAAVAALEAAFGYDALDTCAADGLCATACPVGIDTGTLTKRLRAARHLPLAHRAALWVATHFTLTERAVRTGLRLGRIASLVVGDGVLTNLSRIPRLVLRRPTPLWLRPMPRPAGTVRVPTRREGAVAVYFPACVSRTMGALPGETEEQTLVATLVQLAARAGTPVWIPPDAEGHCCGVPFSSKGYAHAHRAMVTRTIDSFWRWSDGGRLPVVLDTSPCAYGLKQSRETLDAETRARFDCLTILDSIEFVARTLLPRLDARHREARVVLHPVCSVVKMGLSADLERIARACATDVIVPIDAGCCGFAGNRGWLVPALTASATTREADEVREIDAGAYSSSRTCEIGLARATGRVYRSYLFLLERATRVP